MENIIKNIKESDIWKYIHNDNNIDNIMVYLKNKDIDYSAFDRSTIPVIILIAGTVFIVRGILMLRNTS